jgi:hypothetical protein
MEFDETYDLPRGDVYPEAARALDNRAFRGTRVKVPPRARSRREPARPESGPDLKHD